MKKFISLLISLLVLVPATSPLADDINQNKKYNNFIENSTSLGADNLNDNLGNNSPLMSYGAERTINNIVILIRFKGEEEFMNEEKSIQIENSYNLFKDLNNDKIADLDFVSLNSYINDLTYGSIRVNSSFYPKNDTTYLSIEAPETREYYEQYQAGSKVENDLVKWAFDSVKASINLSPDELDTNNDGNIDVVTFICSGSTTKNNMLWAHATNFSGYTTLNGKKLSSYNLINIGTSENNIFNKNTLKVVIHEFLHVFNYPDLYRYYYSGTPVGEWDIMANSAGYGQLPLIYTRNFYSNLNINIREINTDGTYTLKNSQSSNKNDVLAYKIKSPMSDKEYFMVEFRKKSGNWDSSLPGSGLIVYRINENVDYSKGNREGYPDHIYVFRPGEVNSTFASGNTRNAFLSQESGRTSIGNKDLNINFDSNSLFFEDGRNSGIVISNVGSAMGDEITFDVTFPKEKSIELTSIIGNDRYDTAAKLSNLNFKSADTAILVNGLALADGLAVSPLAAHINSPILLVRNTSIPKETINELKRLGVKNVILIGGENVISNKLYNELKSLGIYNIQRIAGIDRYETSLEIAKYIDKNYYDVDKVVIANGLTEADAMSIAAVSGRERMPIILSRPKELNINSYNWLKAEDLKDAYIIGGKTAISDTVLDKVNSITHSNVWGNRIGGSDRYETNAMVIRTFNNNNIDKIYLSKGLTLVDALTAAPIAANKNGTIVLCNTNLSSSQKDVLSNLNIKNLIEVGGGISKFSKEEIIRLAN